MRFKDAMGREWCCRVDWAAIRRSVAAGVDLSLVEAHLGDFHRGSVKLVDALWSVLAPAAETAGVTREQFESGIAGQVMEDGREALLAGCADFFPKSRAELMQAASAEVASEIHGLLSQSRRRSTVSPENVE